MYKKRTTERKDTAPGGLLRKRVSRRDGVDFRRLGPVPLRHGRRRRQEGFSPLLTRASCTHMPVECQYRNSQRRATGGTYAAYRLVSSAKDVGHQHRLKNPEGAVPDDVSGPVREPRSVPRSTPPGATDESPGPDGLGLVLEFPWSVPGSTPPDESSPPLIVVSGLAAEPSWPVPGRVPPDESDPLSPVSRSRSMSALRRQ